MDKDTRHSRIVVTLLSTLLLASAHAGLIVNGSFENGNYSGHPSFMRLSPGSTDLTGWSIGDSGVDWHTGFEFTPKDGDFVIDLNLDGGGRVGTISQSFATVAGQEYVLSFHLAGPNTGFPDPRQVQVDIAGVTQIFSQAASVTPDVVWGSKRLPFTATDTTTTLKFSSVNSSGFWGPLLDQVDVEAVPSSPVLLLLGSGLLGMSMFRRLCALRS